MAGLLCARTGALRLASGPSSAIGLLITASRTSSGLQTLLCIMCIVCIVCIVEDALMQGGGTTANLSDGLTASARTEMQGLDWTQTVMDTRQLKLPRAPQPPDVS